MIRVEVSSTLSTPPGNARALLFTLLPLILLGPEQIVGGNTLEVEVFDRSTLKWRPATVQLEHRAWQQTLNSLSRAITRGKKPAVTVGTVIDKADSQRLVSTGYASTLIARQPKDGSSQVWKYVYERTTPIDVALYSHRLVEMRE